MKNYRFNCLLLIIIFSITIIISGCKKTDSSNASIEGQITTWKSHAEIMAKKNENVVQVYACESTLQQMIALAHAVMYAKNSNPSNRNKILFFYTTQSLKPNTNVFANLGIQFFPTSSNGASGGPNLGKESYQVLADKLDGRQFDLYIPDRGFWFSDNLKDNLYYFAHARNINFFEEGTGSYSYFYVNPPTDESHNSNKEQIISYNITALNNFPLKSTINNYNNCINSSNFAEYSNFLMSIGATIPWWFAHLDQVQTFWQHPEAINKNGLSHIPLKINIIDIYNSLSNEERIDFCKYLGYDVSTMNKKYFDVSPKKNLIIIGTYTSSSDYVNQQMVEWVKVIIQKYGSIYDIFYKPHPRFIQESKNILKASGVTNYTFIEEIFPLELIELSGKGDFYCSTLSSSVYFGDIYKKLDHIIWLNPLPIDYSNIAWIQLKNMGILTDNQYVDVLTLKERWKL